jgi:hypothetical protein
MDAQDWFIFVFIVTAGGTKRVARPHRALDGTLSSFATMASAHSPGRVAPGTRPIATGNSV